MLSLLPAMFRRHEVALVCFSGLQLTWISVSAVVGIADEPVAADTDSGIAACTAQHSDQPMHTFCGY